MTKGRVTGFGGSGFLGRQIVKRLAADGTHVRVAVRRPEQASFLEAFAPGGQIAVQLPANDDHPSHVIARALAGSEFRDQLEGYERVFPLLTPVRYAELLHELGFVRQQVRMQVYAHVLPDTRAVIEWVKGSLLTPFRERLSAADYARFLERYEHELLAAEGDQQPYLYPFKRILMWGRRASPGG